jgi:hypothetical protein
MREMRVFEVLGLETQLLEQGLKSPQTFQRCVIGLNTDSNAVENSEKSATRGALRRS